MSKLNKGDIVKVILPDGTDKLGLISEVADDTMIRIAQIWFDLSDCEITILHSEVDTASQTMV